MALKEAQAPAILRRGRVAEVRPQAQYTECLLADRTTLRLSPFLGRFVRPGDEIEFPLAFDGSAGGPEVHVVKASASRWCNLYQAPIRYVTQPKADKRSELLLRAEVPGGGLGVLAVQLTNESVRDYFYSANRNRPWDQQPTLYDTLRVSRTASAADLRLAFKVRKLEMEVEGAPVEPLRTIERAFNLLASPDLRACYDALLGSSEAPALFPHGGFGSILVSGELSRDRQTFFAYRILSFLPNRRQRRFRAQMRQIDYQTDLAIYRDGRRKVEVLLDAHMLPLGWEPTWNQWKHLLGAKVGVDAMFVQCGKYRPRRGEWELVQWETPLPSRLHVTLPAGVQQEIEAARRTHHRFGEFSPALEDLRRQVEQRPMERSELERICSTLSVPGDFDIAQLTWRPDYTPFFYDQLRRRARKMFLFRTEYIFEFERSVVVEVPELGHATYVFARPRSLDDFLSRYARTTKEDIRKNRDNVAEALGFVGRVIHGSNPRLWLKEIRVRAGEPVDYAQART